ncbi:MULTISPECIES: hypothetical protein [Dactylosporangium]|uniref:Uncharacterized protein n=2 Tax=Dactylosporangium TaxID=35753 RepID=A0A9W6KLA0_9ACTN|nr:MULTISPECIES: hypothetical protein [Dactylosporangium]UAB97651.1 hypothetical protein Dvina_05860 [Dactylosporangium vinaceum]UWZ45895.1 hypothetical protein Dmats_05340 [Dactylosporangium matsuzakiense]GLL02940.1 hypothetical protein GCM10017581_046820 [Dactylosporangium matsuzakiense]
MSIDGSYRLQVETGKGVKDWQFDITEAGAAFNGTMTTTSGSMEVEQGTVAGNELTWVSMLAARPMKVKVRGKATVDGDGIRGELDMGAYGRRAFSGSRA